MGIKQDKARMGYIAVKPGDTRVDRDNWQTPGSFLTFVRQVLGQIDFDPFSSELANKTVKAREFYTLKDDALVKIWPQVDTVFMNPPYGRGTHRDAIERFIKQFMDGRFTRAIVLTNNTTETGAGSRLLNECSAVCFPSFRIQFVTDDGKNSSGNTRGQMVTYFTNRHAQISYKRLFMSVFENLGPTFRR